MLHVNPAMLPRLDTIEGDLLRRRDRASQEGWLGEIEGIDVTLSRLRGKRHQPLRVCRTAGTVHLGISGEALGRWPVTGSVLGRNGRVGAWRHVHLHDAGGHDDDRTGWWTMRHRT